VWVVGITVGFDLDMTLIDARPGMAAAMNALGVESGLPLDGDAFAANLGPPLDDILPSTVALPGAVESLRAVRAAGGRTLVVTGKYGPNAQLHVDALGLDVDEVVGELWSTQKAEALLAHDARVYVGDHAGDIRGALAAGAIAVGVTTGPCDRTLLLSEGAEVVFESLTEFPEWFEKTFATVP
jgi:phosphoglycolate phosphatase